jgi:hypothetical protein
MALGAVLIAFGGVMPAHGDDNARFDLIGPRIEVHVTRAGVTLPISSVPNLQPGDRLWLHPDLPATQSVHYLMVLAFLRGTTNPPPDNWFVRIETWDKKVREEGVEVTVPGEAQQAVLFLAPVTGGDFTTLRSAVQGRPGIFVRASQDLAAAGFEQARIEKYISSMRELSSAEVADPKQLLEHSKLIAATLALKPNGDCVNLPPDQQYTCLTQSGNQTLLDDGHGQSIIDALTGGNSAGLISTASATQLAGAGIYSAYVGTVVDLVHIMGSLHTAQYQYIPAIALPQQQSLNLRLNTAPSFHNPKSVIVIGLPSIQQTIPPPLRSADPKLATCLQRPGVVLPVEGAPLVFSTGFAHDLVLHLNYPADAKRASAQPQDIPLTADAFHGGLVLAPTPKRRVLSLAKVSLPTLPSSAGALTTVAELPAPANTDKPPAADAMGGPELTGTVQGFWGFDPFTGPTVPLENSPGQGWKLVGGDPLIAGRNHSVLLSATGTACVQSITLYTASGKQEPETWKPGNQPDTVEVALDLAAHDSGALNLAIRQFGDPKPATVRLVSYSEPAKLDALHLHAGDTSATLIGTSLDQVRHIDFDGLTFKPALQTTDPSGSTAGSNSELSLTLPVGAPKPTLPVGDRLTAQVTLKDDRTLAIPIVVEAARPSVALIAKADVPSEAMPKTQFSIKLAGQNDLPITDALMFSVRSAQPFPRKGEIEIASPDDSLHTTLSVSDSNASFILEDPQTILAVLQPLRAFGPSAFGPLRLRAVAPDETAGDWLPLATLVRLPTLTALTCPAPAPSVSAPSTNRSAPTDAEGPATPAAGSPSTDTASDARAADAGETTSTPGSVAGLSGLAAAPGSAPGSAGPATPESASKSTASSVPPNTPDKPVGLVSSTGSQPTPCTLTGTGLYFIDAVSTDASFTKPTLVPAGFVGSSLALPLPTGAVYYLRLRDDPAAVDTVILPASPASQTKGASTRLQSELQGLRGESKSQETTNKSGSLPPPSP